MKIILNIILARYHPNGHLQQEGYHGLRKEKRRGEGERKKKEEGKKDEI